MSKKYIRCELCEIWDYRGENARFCKDCVEKRNKERRQAYARERRKTSKGKTKEKKRTEGTLWEVPDWYFKKREVPDARVRGRIAYMRESGLFPEKLKKLESRWKSWLEENKV